MTTLFIYVCFCILNCQESEARRSEAENKAAMTEAKLSEVENSSGRKNQELFIYVCFCILNCQESEARRSEAENKAAMTEAKLSEVENSSGRKNQELFIYVCFCILNCQESEARRSEAENKAAMTEAKLSEVENSSGRKNQELEVIIIYVSHLSAYTLSSVPPRIMTCQCFLSSAISVVIWFLAISSFTRYRHLSFGLPRFRFPSTVICNIFLVASSLSRLCTRPNHLNLFSLRNSASGTCLPLPTSLHFTHALVLSFLLPTAT